MASDRTTPSPDMTERQLTACGPWGEGERMGRDRLSVTLVLSIAVHALLLAALLFLHVGRPPQDLSAPSDVAMVFEAGGEKAPSNTSPDSKTDSAALSDKPGTPPPTPEDKPDTSQPSPSSAPPNPPAPPQPQEAPPQVAPVPPAPQSQAPSTTPAQQPPAPVPDIPLPPEPAPDAVPLAPPPPTTESPPAPPSPPQPRTMPQPPVRAPKATPRTSSRPPGKVREAPGSSLSSPLNYSLGGAARGLRHNNPFASMPNNLALGNDWKAALRRWVQEHGYYPRDAAMRGEDGPVTLQLTINRFGVVTDVQMLESSGSQALDMAWTSVWRGSRVPPFPPGTKEDSITITYTGNYILQRR
ncbi:energy transducer TonB [Granulibacter bethesdensis]|uniref:TonB family protein n=1 Tax=Granulibacter bethesdensis (strain ATCC BAA-1260 / CGDNIH1) TaxID=391165 RepID=Q0BUS1_GRABC|nr:energy transducer TonB [Granulibacter bethesdensis]ABI61431.1 TonB family protein [Granulibacter bethesdensis CGDNIH1]AHJ67559.1 TonB family protein [Granulibacter bethesdensis]APH51224.1 TonB family protein [Granulibacter bethesdensis]APH63918.1 TonB family protein [Granulibacter bethesdensis]